MRDKWAEISENLKKMLKSGLFKVWIAPLRASVHEGGLHLVAPNAYVAGRLESMMLASLREAAAPVLGLEPEQVDVRIEAADQGASEDISEKKQITTQDSSVTKADVSAFAPSVVASFTAPARAPRQAALPLAPVAVYRDVQNWRYSFADFVVGPTNNMAVAAAQDVSRSCGCVRTLFVNSTSGLGKTHLAQAVGRAISEEGTNARVGYLTAEEFASRFVTALRAQDIEGFKARFRELDVLLMEDVHFFQGKEKMQDMALAVVKSLQAKGGRAIFTSSFSPRELQKVDSQLVSHFCSGILTDMGRPTKDMRCDILGRKARTFQVLLPDSVCELLASRLTGDVRQMESCLNSLIFKARLLSCGLNVDLAMEVLSQYADVACGPDFSTIMRLVCESYGLNERQLSSRSRRKECVVGRNTAFYLARKHTEMTLEEIGEKFNRRHSTVIKGITSLERELSRESTEGRRIARAVSLIERNAGLAGRPM